MPLAAGDAPLPGPEAGQAGMIRELLQQLRQMQEESHHAQVQQLKNLVEHGDGERLAASKALDWTVYRPSAFFYPVSSLLIKVSSVGLMNLGLVDTVVR